MFFLSFSWTNETVANFCFRNATLKHAHRTLIHFVQTTKPHDENQDAMKLM